MVRSILLSLLLLFLTAPLNEATAQSPPQFEEATIAFDVRMSKARSGEFMKNLGMEEQLKALSQNASSDIDFEKLERVYGAMTLPDDLATFMEMTNSPSAPETLPMDMLFVLQCADSATAKSMYESMEEKSEKETIGGKTYLKPPTEEGMQNMLMHMPNDTSIEMGTRNYMLQEKRMKKLFSDGLGAAWKKVPDHAFRMAIDLKAESKLISQAVEMGKANSGSGQQAAMTNAYLDLVDNAENLRFSVDMDAANIIVIAATGVDDSKAEELRSGLDAIMGMAKMGGKAGLGQMGQMIPPDVSKVANSILDSLKATADGKDVRIAIPKPDGFNDAMKTAMKQAMQMMPPPMDMEEGSDSSDDF